MWLSNVFNTFKLKRLLKTKISDITPNRRLLVMLLNELRPEAFSNYRPTTGLTESLNVRYSDIGNYIEKIVLTNAILRKKEGLPNTWDTGKENETTLDKWLVADGYYVDVVMAISDFKNNALMMCELMADSDTAQYGVPEHNLRMLTKMFVNATHVTKKLIEISLK
jgi:hypothetical protein